jgi:hypothetical protein
VLFEELSLKAGANIAGFLIVQKKPA